MLTSISRENIEYLHSANGAIQYWDLLILECTGEAVDGRIGGKITDSTEDCL